MIGMCMGIIYGSGLIIKAAHDGTLDRRDIFGSVTLMGLAHAVIEDTLLVMMFGASWIIVLPLRVVLAVFICAVAMRLRDRWKPFGSAP
jgi:hypothetical protein